MLLKVKILSIGMLMLFSSIISAETISESQLVAQQSKTIDKSGSKTTSNSKTSPKSNNWRPNFLKTKTVESTSVSFTEVNVGVGFLYFSGINGNLQPTELAVAVKSNQKLSGHLTYNRTPLVELVVGTSILNWLKLALSYQHQGVVGVQTKPQVLLTSDGSSLSPSVFLADLSLDALMAKFYLFSPWTMNWKKIYYEPYLALAVGPSWQTWDKITTTTGVYRQKISANCAYTIDLGLKLRQAIASYILSFTIGCKYNQWGQARSMGKLQDQYASSVDQTGFPLNGNREALSNPLRIKVVYQFAPYAGVQLNF